MHGLRRETGMTVFLTTHYMEEADDADTVVIMDDGEIVAQGTPNDLKNRFSGDYVKIYRQRDPSLDAMFEAEQLDFTYEGEAYRIKLASTAEAKRFIGGHDNIVTDFEVIKGDMDDVFLRATGKKLQGGGV